MIKRVLVIDDDIRHTKMMSYLLLSKGFEVSHFLSAEEALDKLTSEDVKKPDIILLDIMMPGLNGMEFLLRLRKTPTIMNIPIIIISAVPDSEKMEEVRSLGVMDYIEKPFSPTHIIRAINKISEQIKTS